MNVDEESEIPPPQQEAQQQRRRIGPSYRPHQTATSSPGNHQSNNSIFRPYNLNNQSWPGFQQILRNDQSRLLRTDQPRICTNQNQSYNQCDTNQNRASNYQAYQEQVSQAEAITRSSILENRANLLNTNSNSDDTSSLSSNNSNDQSRNISDYNNAPNDQSRQISGLNSSLHEQSDVLPSTANCDQGGRSADIIIRPTTDGIAPPVYPGLDSQGVIANEPQTQILSSSDSNQK